MGERHAGAPQLSSHALDKQHMPSVSLIDISLLHHMARCIDSGACSGF